MGHVEPVFVVAAIRIAGCLLLVAGHLGHIGIEPRLGVQDVECLGFDNLSADERRGRSDAVCGSMYGSDRRSGNLAQDRMEENKAERKRDEGLQLEGTK